jgi:hypothetical protein
MRANDLGCPLESEARLRLHVFSLSAAMKLPVCYRLMRERPQPLGRLPCGGIGRPEVPMYASRYTHVGAAMPTGPSEHEPDLLPLARADRPGKRVQGEGAGGS